MIDKICAHCNFPVILIKTKKTNNYWNKKSQSWIESPYFEKIEEFACNNPNPTKYCNPVTVKIVDIN